MSITLHKNAHLSDANMHETKGFPSGGKQYSTRKAINGLSEFQRDHRLPNAISTANGYDAPLTEVNGDIYLIESPVMPVADIVYQSAAVIRYTFDSGYDSSLYAVGSYFQNSGEVTQTVHNGIFAILTVNASYLEVTNSTAGLDGGSDVTGSDATGYVTHEDYDPENLGNDNSIPSSGQVRFYSAQDLWYGDAFQKGDNWFNEEIGAFQHWDGSIVITSGIFSFSQTADKTVTDTSSETTILGTGIGSLTLPANFFSIGKLLRFHIHGYHSSVSDPNITIKVKLGATELMSATVASGNGTNDGFDIEGEIVCRTIGASGTVVAAGSYNELHSGGASVGTAKTTATTIDTTSALTFDVTIQWGVASASNSMTSQITILKSVN